MPASSRRNSTLLLAALFGTLVAGCGTDDSSTETGTSFGNFSQASAVISVYSNNVVAATYEELDRRVGLLVSAVTTLRNAPTDANLAAARTAWKSAREPWEQSEGFLFGPVDSNGFDPALDSWPVNQTDLDGVLASGDALTATYLENLDPSLKGFHTAEYLMFGVDSMKPASALTRRELDYLVGVTNEMRRVTTALRDSWTVGWDGQAAYGPQFTSAGETGNRLYPSKEAAAEELVRGMMTILDEVANGKIADPFDNRDPNLVESQFSFNSLEDFADNIRSVQNAYTGDNQLTGQFGTGFDEFVASVNPDLDQRFKTELSQAITALGRIRSPFRDAIMDPTQDDEILAAQQAINTCLETAQNRILKLVTE